MEIDLVKLSWLPKPQWTAHKIGSSSNQKVKKVGELMTREILFSLFLKEFMEGVYLYKHLASLTPSIKKA